MERTLVAPFGVVLGGLEAAGRLDLPDGVHGSKAAVATPSAPRTDADLSMWYFITLPPTRGSERNAAPVAWKLGCWKCASSVSADSHNSTIEIRPGRAGSAAIV